MNDDSSEVNDEDILEEEYIFEETGIDWTGVVFVHEGDNSVDLEKIKGLVNYVHIEPEIKSFSLEEVCETLRLEFDLF